MLDIESVNGILIAPNGTFKSFGIHSDESVRKLTAINFHDSSFKMQIANDVWFKKLQKDLNFKYTNDTIHRQAMDWASKGVMTMIHAGVKGMEAYCVLSPAQISKEQKELLEKNYVNLKNQIIKNNAYFETYVFSSDEECVCTGPLYGEDSFYDLFEDSTKKNKHI